MDVLKDLTGSAVKVYLAMRGLTDGYLPFSASIAHLVHLTGLTHSTVVYARLELVAKHVVKESFPPGYYAFVQHPVAVSDASRGDLDTRTNYKRGSRKGRGGRAPARDVAESDRAAARLEVEGRRSAVKRACAVLRIPETGRYVQMGMRKLHGLARDGFTADDALLVARYCREEYDKGDRFKKRLNLLYIWSAGEFSPLLAAARTTPSHERVLSNISDPDTRRAWHEDYLRRVKERGLD